MPCYDARDHEPDPHLVDAGNLLCDFMRRWEFMGRTATPPSIAMKEWWEKHKQRDSQSIATLPTTILQLVSGEKHTCECGNQIYSVLGEDKYECINCGTQVWGSKV